MSIDFVALCPLVPRAMPLIGFLFIGSCSCVCSTLLPDAASQQRPCASL